MKKILLACALSFTAALPGSALAIQRGNYPACIKQGTCDKPTPYQPDRGKWIAVTHAPTQRQEFFFPIFAIGKQRAIDGCIAWIVAFHFEEMEDYDCVTID